MYNSIELKVTNGKSDKQYLVKIRNVYSVYVRVRQVITKCIAIAANFSVAFMWSVSAIAVIDCSKYLNCRIYLYYRRTFGIVLVHISQSIKFPFKFIEEKIMVKHSYI